MFGIPGKPCCWIAVREGKPTAFEREKGTTSISVALKLAFSFTITLPMANVKSAWVKYDKCEQRRDETQVRRCEY